MYKYALLKGFEVRARMENSHAIRALDVWMSELVNDPALRVYVELSGQEERIRDARHKHKLMRHGSMYGMPLHSFGGSSHETDDEGFAPFPDPEPFPNPAREPSSEQPFNSDPVSSREPEPDPVSRLHRQITIMGELFELRHVLDNMDPRNIKGSTEDAAKSLERAAVLIREFGQLSD